MRTPDFASLNRIEEDLLKAKLESIRKSIAHAGEKGRALEFNVCQLLRDLLPREYGLTTGFVAWLSPDGPALSSQLDIIIYDAVHGSPLIHLETCDVMPLEAVYGYVEVKAALRSTSDKAKLSANDSIEACIAKNAEIRKMNTRAFRVSELGSPSTVGFINEPWLPIRSYVVALEAVGAVAKDADAFATRMATVLKQRNNAHIHGVLIPNHGFFYTRPVHPNSAPEDAFHVLYATDHPLIAFKTLLLQALATFRRPEQSWTPAIEHYFSYNPQWQERWPRSDDEQPHGERPAD